METEKNEELYKIFIYKKNLETRKEKNSDEKYVIFTSKNSYSLEEANKIANDIRDDLGFSDYIVNLERYFDFGSVFVNALRETLEERETDETEEEVIKQ